MISKKQYTFPPKFYQNPDCSVSKIPETVLGSDSDKKQAEQPLRQLPKTFIGALPRSVIVPRFPPEINSIFIPKKAEIVVYIYMWLWYYIFGEGLDFYGIFPKIPL